MEDQRKTDAARARPLPHVPQEPQFGDCVEMDLHRQPCLLRDESMSGFIRVSPQPQPRDPSRPWQEENGCLFPSTPVALSESALYPRRHMKAGPRSAAQGPPTHLWQAWHKPFPTTLLGL